MGYPEYSTESRVERAASLGYFSAPREEIFKARNINSSMDPYGVKIRESRDSENHPESLAIVLGLDVTGSMGTVPHHLVKDGLPTIMETIIKSGVEHPQVLFTGIGDHECDESPLQIGQFESGDEMLDKWLTDLYLEGGGGRNPGESYMLAWYFSAHHTSIDCFEKRNQKGFIFTIGDEPVLPSISARALKKIMGAGQYAMCSSEELLIEAQKKYHVFHVHMTETQAGTILRSVDKWKDLIGDNLLICDRHDDVPKIISQKIIETMNPVKKIKKEKITL